MMASEPLPLDELVQQGTQESRLHAEAQALDDEDGYYLGWMKNLEFYRQSGAVNGTLLDQAVVNARLLAIADQARFYDATKHLVHRVVTLLMMPFVLPIFFLIALAIKLETRGPAIYVQMRTGRFGMPFHIYKFRTMYVGAERMKYMQVNEMKHTLFKNAEDPRVTRVGRFLRRWSLDETPQLFNVLLGDMDLIGPRPYPPEDSVTTDFQSIARFAVRPGLTGLWQSTCRESMDGYLKMRLDAEYVERRGWLLDASIVWKTIKIVISGRGAY